MMLPALDSSRADVARLKIGVWLILVAVSITLCMGMLRTPAHQNRATSVFNLGYLVGPVTQSLIDHHGLLVCTENMGTPGDPICFRSARMPLPANVLAFGVRYLGDRPDRVAIAKNLIFLLPLWAAMWLVLTSLPGGRARILAGGAILIAPFFVVSYLIVITGMDIEEGYLFGLIPLALALIYCVRKPSLIWALGMGVLLDLIYLTKSSMLPVIAVLLAISVLRLQRLSLRFILAALVVLAPISWGIHQKDTSGRFSVGTSLDGINFHKGNNPEFQNIYPITNSYLDSLDSRFNRGHYFSDEWVFNDFHLREGRTFAFNHPSYTLGSMGKKIYVLFISRQAYIATPLQARTSEVVSIGMLLFRILLWVSILIAAVSVTTGLRGGRSFGLIYLLFLAAYSLPYIIGFGFIRHAIVLAYPAAIFCALSLRAVWRPDSQRRGLADYA